MKLGRKAAAKVRNGFRMDACGYLYADGILVNIKETVKVAGQDVRVEVFYARFGEIAFSANGGHDVPGRIVCHEAKSLLDGITKVEVYFESSSPNMLEHGLTCDTITFTTESGAIHRGVIYPYLSSEFTIQSAKNSEHLLSDVVRNIKDTGGTLVLEE